MNPLAAELLERALTLSSEDRGALASALIDSLDDEEADYSEEIDPTWAAEIKRRVDAIHAGTAKFLTLEEFERLLDET